MNLSKKLLAEFIGTFALIFIGVSSICNNAGLVGVALAHGLTIAVMVSAFGHISGGHFNPAVTVGAWAGRKIKTGEAIPYIIVQLAAGVGGALIVKAVFPDALTGPSNLGTPALAEGIGAAAGMKMEAILTFFLVTAVFGTAIDTRAPKTGGLFIGLTIVLGILAGGPLTGASMNPARAFGPALVAGFWDNHIVYWIGPLIGGALAGYLYSRFTGKEGM